MTQLTIRGVDDRLSQALRREAQRRGTSLNRIALQLLRESLGQAMEPATTPYTDLDHLAGTWSPEEAAEFNRLLADQRPIDETLWR